MHNVAIQKYWFQKHPRTTLIGITFWGMVISLIFIEFAARIFFPHWAPNYAERVNFWIYHEVLGWSHRPGQCGRFSHRDFSVEVSINAHGLRDKEYSLKKPNNKKRMLILGDSFAWGFGVESHERFSEILESSHSNWEIINAAVSGYGSDQQLLYLKEQGLSYKPDVVLLLFFRNDFDENISHERYWYHKPYFTLKEGGLQLQNIPVPKSTLKQKLDRFFWGKTYTWKYIYYIGMTTFKKIGKIFTEDVGGYHPSTELSEQQNQFDVTYHLLKAINDLSARNNAKFILVSIPMSKEKRATLQEFSAKEGCLYLSLDRFFSNLEQDTTFPHDHHWNAIGHKAASIAIDQFLQDFRIF